MNSTMRSLRGKARPSAPPGVVGAVAEKEPEVETELAQYLPHFSRMSEQLKQTSSQIESSVVEVCNSFQGIAERAKQTVARTTGFLSQDGEGTSDTAVVRGPDRELQRTLWSRF